MITRVLEEGEAEFLIHSLTEVKAVIQTQKLSAPSARLTTLPMMRGVKLVTAI
jgi:hypothetical protein